VARSSSKGTWFTVSEYKQINGLANYWDRDYRRLELAKWVYNHPDEAEELIALIEERYGIQEDEEDEEI